MTKGSATNTGGRTQRIPRKGASTHARGLLRGKGLPFVLVNMAMTADGKIATANRAVSTFSSRRDFEHLLELRATADAVLSGARTADEEAVNLGPGPARFRRLRLKNGLAEYNLRIVASGSGSLSPGAEVFRHHFSPVIVLASERAPERRLTSSARWP